ncbi:hypothetical protein B566_EDAN008866 [Ephemera danica]|nr:hypothetical protein B566_EDAN008866 [Ephemera danica]
MKMVEFVEGWTLSQTLGEGAYGEVKLLTNATTGEAVAMKIVNLEKHPEARTSLRKEVCIHRMLVNPQIIRFWGHRREASLEYIFLEYASGGELFDRIEPDVGMPVWEAQKYFKQLLSGIERLLEKRCGTLPYVAPEVLIRPYFAQPADVWSCGIILVAMLAGELPWDKAASDCPEYMAWKDGKFTQSPWNKLDNMSLSLLRKILAPLPSSRSTIEQIKSHRWLCRRQTKNYVRPVDSFPRPASKRLCSGSELSPGCSEEDVSRLCQSQPEPFALASSPSEAGQAEERVPSAGFCFSQPAQLEDLLLSSQLHSTQPSCSQTSYQKLVKRMTRFFVKTDHDETLRTLTGLLEKCGYSWKRNAMGDLTITTVDKRKMQLVFKANLIEMDNKILLNFRLSKGCGLDFKRIFVHIKNSLTEIILKGPVMWPIAIATNSVP